MNDKEAKGIMPRMVIQSNEIDRKTFFVDWKISRFDRV
jgi:hypothetical protein